MASGESAALSVSSNSNHKRWVYSSEELKQKAIKELREDPDKVYEELEKFREKILSEKVKCRMDDFFLLAFLRVRKYNQKNAFRSLLNSQRIWKKYGHLLLVKNTIEDIRRVYSQNIIHTFQRRDEHGRFLMLGIVANWDTDTFKVEDILMLPLLIGLCFFDREEFQVNGTVIIFDLKGLTVTHIAKLVVVAVDIIRAIQDSLPARFKACHVINQNKWLDAPRKLFWPLLMEKFKKRIFFHGSDMSSLHKHVSTDLLPAEYGGQVPLSQMERINYHETKVTPIFEF